MLICFTPSVFVPLNPLDPAIASSPPSAYSAHSARLLLSAVLSLFNTTVGSFLPHNVDLDMHVPCPHAVLLVELNLLSLCSHNNNHSSKEPQQAEEGGPHLDSASFPIVDPPEDAPLMGLGDELPQLHPLQGA